MALYLSGVFFNMIAIGFIIIYDILVNENKYPQENDVLIILLLILGSWFIDLILLMIFILSYLKNKYF